MSTTATYAEHHNPLMHACTIQDCSTHRSHGSQALAVGYGPTNNLLCEKHYLAYVKILILRTFGEQKQRRRKKVN